MKLSEHFYLEELSTSSHKEIDNFPPQSIVSTGLYIAECMEAVRAILDSKPISISSWYRSPKLNAAVGGSKNSQHMKGEAVDFICPQFGTPYDVARKLSMHKDKLLIDQLIYEGTWVHISFVIPPRVPRLEALTYLGKGKYLSGIQLRKE